MQVDRNQSTQCVTPRMTLASVPSASGRPINDIHGSELVAPKRPPGPLLGSGAPEGVPSVEAERQLSHARDEDTVCRNSGAEFHSLLIDLTDHEALARIDGMTSEAIACPIGRGGPQFTNTPNLGTALDPDQGTSGPVLITHAGAAMHQSRQRRSPCECLVPGMTPGVVAPPTSDSGAGRPARAAGRLQADPPPGSARKKRAISADASGPLPSV